MTSLTPERRKAAEESFEYVWKKVKDTYWDKDIVDGMTPEQRATVQEALVAFPSVESAHHGDCVGAYAEFH